MGQAPIKVNEETKERIRYLAALTDATQAEVVDRAVSEYAARHADEIAAGMERARAVLASGDAATTAYLIEESIEAVERIAGAGKDSGTGELEERVRQRGEMEKEAILEAGGPSLTQSQVAARLGVDEGKVEGLRTGDKLLGLPVNGEYVYPAWQFRGSDLLAGIAESLRALSPHNPWLRAAFFLGTSDYLGGQSPLTELEQGHVTQVVRAARAIGEHGAA